MATSARSGHAEFVRRETTHSTPTRTKGSQRASARRPEPASASSVSFEAQWAISETPNQAARGAAHACPGAIEGCAASPRGPGHVTRRSTKPPQASSFATSPNSAAAINEGSRSFPDAEGLPAHCACTPQAPGSAGAAKQALPSARSGGSGAPHRQPGAATSAAAHRPAAWGST